MSGHSTETPSFAVTEADYLDGLAIITRAFQASMTSALTTAIDDHEALLASVLVRRISTPLADFGTSRGDSLPTTPNTRATQVADRASMAGHGRRTARELVLDALAMASEPISFADVKLAVVAAGGSELGAHKVRTDLLKKGAIVNRRGLYTLTETGQEMRAAYG